MSLSSHEIRILDQHSGERQDLPDIYTHLATKYNVPRILVKRTLFAVMYSGNVCSNAELEELFLATYRMFL